MAFRNASSEDGEMTLRVIQLPHRLVEVVAAVPPKPAAPTPGLRSESLPHSAAGMNPSPTVIKS